MDPKTAFGQVLRKARKATGLSQENFADAIVMDRTTISLIERGRQNTTIETLWKICEHLNVSPSELIAEVEKLNPEIPD